MIKLRQYQDTAVNKINSWWQSHPGYNQIPLVTMPTASGKSVVIAELARRMFDYWPEHHPRTIVLVPSKELAEQNAEKLGALLPPHIRVGFYSASLGKKCPDADVIVATIGSIYKAAHELGDIKVIVIDEAHLVNSDGLDTGRYRQFLSSLAKYCKYRAVGLTATPFRGNGVWLTEGTDPLFSGVAYTVKMQLLLNQKYLAPLVRPIDVLGTRIDTTGISTTSGDFNIGELSTRVENYLVGAAHDACKLADDRRKWIAFLPTVANAHNFCRLLNERNIPTAVVTGETSKKDREHLIRLFRSGELRCLVTVLALATGFDVPDVDCILWLRPTKSPVLYVQGAGRGMRIADGKQDCLWLDFSDTTERLGPIDAIKGRTKKATSGNREAPSATCPECGEIVIPASLLFCPSCSAQMRELGLQDKREASNHAILAAQVAPKYITYNVTRVAYRAHFKSDKPTSIRVDYWDGLQVVASEWICPLHGGFVTTKAQEWIDLRTPEPSYRHFYCDPDQAGIHDIKDSSSGLWSIEDWIKEFASDLRQPNQIKVNYSAKFPVIVEYHFSNELAEV
jgi:DNA repair protein RadD